MTKKEVIELLKYKMWGYVEEDKEDNSVYWEFNDCSGWLYFDENDQLIG